jgi:hypothetical protein
LLSRHGPPYFRKCSEGPTITVVEAHRFSLGSIAGLLCLWIAVASASAAPPTTTEPCGRTDTRSALRSFVGAFNAGSFERLDALFAQEPNFQWFSALAPGQRLGADANRRETLLPYFRRRHAAGERFRLKTFDWNGKYAHWSNFGFVALRSKPQRSGWIRSESKGAVICEGGDPRLITLSLGGRPLR